MVLAFTHRLSAPQPADQTLALTADARLRSRYRHTANDGSEVYLNLPRGTVLKGGDCLGAETHTQILQIIAKPEPVLTVSAETALALLRAAYHLGNRHVPLELAPDYLRLSPDPVLAQLLAQLGLQVVQEIAPFEPESGAYHHDHA
ncbi:MAG: urease accessory protein UreE [Leptolyngbya sp. SIO4C1]|nr:urease accessory protein UreE [Leptolyngbya sp. SIO4C1]